MRRFTYRMGLCLLLAGCGKTEVAQNTPSPANPPPASELQESLPPVDGAIHDKTPATVDSYPNLRESVETSPGQSTTEKTPPKTATSAPPQEDDKAPKTAQDFFEVAKQRAMKRDIDGAVAAMRQATQLEPENRNLLLTYASLLQQHGQQLAQSGEAEKAYAHFLESAKLVRPLLKEEPAPGPGEARLINNVLYNEACALAMTGKAQPALASLRQALEAGFDDLSKVAEDPDLDSLRKLPEYDKLIGEFTTKIAKKAREEARELIAAQEAFPFDLSLMDVNDKPVNLVDFKGKITIVDFWATWCPPCRMEIPHFVELQKKYKDDLQIIGVNYENAEGEEAKTLIKEFMKANDMNYPCVIGDEATQGQVPDLEGYPTTLFLDRGGKVRLKVVGYHPLAKLEGIIAELMAEKSPALEAK